MRINNRKHNLAPFVQTIKQELRK